MFRFLWKQYKKYEEIINYLVVGGITTVVSLAAKFICAVTILDATIVWQNLTLSLINWVVGVTVAFILNRKYVFKSQEKNWVGEAKKFVLARVSTYFLDAAVNFILVNLLYQGTFLASFVAAVLVVIANYFLSKLFVFRKERS
ncbi:MAG: GtrA family protein [Lachnospiraceae bacterium]|jgi:putative flippase GtrA|nr:GtrA family protein [Lachnospiraceae bacterium]